MSSLTIALTARPSVADDVLLRRRHFGECADGLSLRNEDWIIPETLGSTGFFCNATGAYAVKCERFL